jgi:choloylglycine hydrolase
MPRGITRDGMTGKNTLRWKAKYGSVVAADMVASDGMNEKGFAAHVLWLTESDYGKRDENVPGLSIGLWVQYFLDNFASVKEAVQFVRKTPFQIVTTTTPAGELATLHLVLEDATGDSAVIEYADGKPNVYEGRGYTVVTNSPTFDRQIEQLKQYKGFGGKKELPGTTQAGDRFVRGAYYLKNLPKPADYRQCVAGVLSVVRNISQPFGVADPARPYVSATRWRTIADLTNRVYFFESTTSPNIVWVQLKDLKFSKGAPVKVLDLMKRPDRIGDTAKQFRTAKPFIVPAVMKQN